MTMKKVLIVEDEKPLQLAVKMKLEKKSVDTLTARSGDEAWRHLKQDPDIGAIWLDHYLLGDVSGLDIAARVKDDENLKKIPIFVVSNTATDDKVQSYLHLGVDKYYTKAHTEIDKVVGEVIETLNQT